MSEATTQAPAVVRDGTRLRVWLLGARAAQITLVAAVLFGVFGLPPLREAIANAIFEPVTYSHGLLGLRTATRRNPNAETLSTVITVVYWVGTLGAAALLLWLRLPAAAGTAGEPSAAPGPRPRQHTDPAPGPGAAPADGDPSLAKTAHGQPAAPSAPPASAPQSSAVWATVAAPSPQAVSEQPSQTHAPSPAGGRYTIEKELGQGGMGVVYCAHDTVLQRIVALKELLPELKRNESLAARFRREAIALAQLTHPHIVQVYDLVEDTEHMWMVMELVDGGSLADRVEHEGALPTGETIRLGAQMARAMAYAHERGIVHRDFKPENVMLTADGQAKVMDFGLAKLMQHAPKLTQSGAIMGSPAYMSPEQASGSQADWRSDIYSFGATLYEMATGHPPFEGDTMSVLTQHLTQSPRPVRELTPELPETLEQLLSRMLEKRPEDRVQQMGDIAAELETASPGQATAG